MSPGEYARLLAIVCPPESVCWLCRGTLGPIRHDLGGRHRLGPSLDHVVPASKGGTWDLSNLRPAHQCCNSARRDRPPSIPRGVRSSRWANAGRRGT
ncbi:HNH endonuclease [Microbacterium rhizomatis]|uniref:HNH endonuclease n=1 Tax=Microbacterium rhizomatis TaxID=1631477 RepID=A0A5J5J9S5_9MICO|nr:HNH endonuclease [Microbacterium rhizomatis]